MQKIKDLDGKTKELEGHMMELKLKIKVLESASTMVEKVSIKSFQS